MTINEETLQSLDVLVGEWSMAASFESSAADAPRARTTFEWLAGRRFLIQRWEVEHPDAPDGIAVIGFDHDGTTLLQHYFDSRGVARVYVMTLADGIWTLERRAGAPDFSQRFVGMFSEDRNTISGRWDTSPDGSTWIPDFSVTYSRTVRRNDAGLAG